MPSPIGHLERVRALALSGRMLFVGGVRAAATSRITVYDLVDGKPVRAIDLPCHVHGLAATPTGAVAACADGALRILDAASDDFRQVPAHAGAALAVAVAGDAVASVGEDGVVRTFGLDGTPRAEHAVSRQPLRAVALDGSGRAVAAGGDDGVARVITAAGVREMPGHDGPVLALAFTPAGDRLLSGGDDGTLRIWYLVGPVECDVRGSGDTGHAGGAFAVLFLPGETEVGAERFVSAGADGKVRVWRLADRRRPRGLDAGSAAVRALAFRSTGAGSTGALLAAGDDRVVRAFAFTADGPTDARPTRYGHGFDVFEEALQSRAQPRRIEAVQALASLDESEALDLALKALASDREAEVRASAARALAEQRRKGALDGLRARLDDAHAAVRTAAFDALRALQADTPLSPLRAALRAGAADVRRAAVQALPPLAPTSPLVAGMVWERLGDDDVQVRRAALAAAVAIEPDGSPVPLRAAFERGMPAVRAEAVALVARDGRTAAPEFAPTVSAALDDEDGFVRRVAFTALVLTRPALARWLAAHDEGFARALDDLARRAAQVGAEAPTDDQVRAVRAELVTWSGDDAPDGSGEAVPGETDREPLLAALACRTPDTALRGARGLALMGDMRALGALLTLSRDPAPDLRREAAQALASLDDPRARRRLAWILDDREAAVRDTALQCLSRLEPAPLDLATRALRAGQQDIRTRGLGLLVEHGKGTDLGARLLGDALDDEAPPVRSEAFRTFWAWHQGDPLAAIDRALAGRFADVRLRAVSELAALARPADSAHRGLALQRLASAIADRDAGVARAAYEAVAEVVGEADPAPHLRAMGSTVPAIRVLGAKGAAKAPPEPIRDAVVRLLEDDVVEVRHAALETIDARFRDDNGPLRAALGGSHLDVRVRAAEHLAVRRDQALIDPMLALLRDDTLKHRFDPATVADLRRRAASALATLAEHRLLRTYLDEIVPDEDGFVKEQGARGLANACRRDDAQLLVGLLGHDDVAVRSWAGEGLARLGDPRGVPVLTGTLRHDHAPIRVGAILSFAALGPEGYGGLLQGLEDPSPEVQRILLAVVLARDLAAYERGERPELLSAALASARPEVRFAAARALELRTDPGAYLAHLVEVMLPERPEKPADLAEWPPEPERERLVVGLARALAGDVPEQRYAALQVLRLRGRPQAFFREAARVIRPRTLDAPWVPENTPHAAPVPEGPDAVARLRRLFAAGGGGTGEPTPEDRDHLYRVAFGAYVGLIRQVAPDDEAHRVRRDAIDRIVDLVQRGRIARPSAVPALARALDDPHHLVRRAGFAALKQLFGDEPDTPLRLALLATSADVLRAALDDLAARGPESFDRIASALDAPVADARKYAFELLEKISPDGSLEPLLAALRSRHADLRIGVLERLQTSSDPRVAQALEKALLSDHEDLRLRAAEILAARHQDLAVDVLDAALRSESDAVRQRARAALVRLGTPAAVRALAGRLGEEAGEGERLALISALGQFRRRAGLEAAIGALVGALSDEAAQVRQAALSAGLAALGPREDAEKRRRPGPRTGPPRPPRDPVLTRDLLRAAARSRFPDLRRVAARELDVLAHPDADALLCALFTDRDPETRVAAVDAYATRVEAGADPAPLADVLRGGARDTMLAAARGLAATGDPDAFRPLLLFVRAGADGEREQALLALGVLGDRRALDELEVVAAGGTEDAPVEPPMQAAAIEALGRMYGRIDDADARDRIRDRIDAALAHGRLSLAGVKALAHIGGERARTRLEGIVASDASPPADRAEAALALGRFGDPGSEKVLAGVLEHWDDAVRWAAWEALRAIFPSERTRIELHAVVSGQPDIAEPAAAYLAAEGDAGALLGILGTLVDDDLRERLRFGVTRREHVPVDDVAKLLGSASAVARADAAWVAGIRADRLAPAEREQLGGALVDAVDRAERGWDDGRRRGDDDAQHAEARAWVNALWAARRVAPERVAAAAARAAARADAPPEVRIEGAHAVGAADRDALAGALGAPDPAVRYAAASGAGPAAVADAAPRPADPAVLARAVGAGPVPEDLLATPNRGAVLPAALRSGELGPLIGLARSGTGRDRLDAIAALGLSRDPRVHEMLGELAFADHEPEEVRRAAFRSRRRVARAMARMEGTA